MSISGWGSFGLPIFVLNMDYILDLEEERYYDKFADNEVDEWYNNMERAAEEWEEEREERGISLGHEEQRRLEDMCREKEQNERGIAPGDAEQRRLEDMCWV